MNPIDAFNGGKAEAFADLHPNKVDPEKVAELQKQIDQGQAIYCVYSEVGGR